LNSTHRLVKATEGYFVYYGYLPLERTENVILLSFANFRAIFPQPRFQITTASWEDKQSPVIFVGVMLLKKAISAPII